MKRPTSVLAIFAVLASVSQSVEAQQICTADALQEMRAKSITEALITYKTVSLTKDEFETTAAFESRVEQVQQSLPRGPLLITMPKDGLTKFDADTGTVTVSPYALSTTCLLNEYSLKPEVKAVRFGNPSRIIGSTYCLSRVVKSVDGGTYEASNGYGAKTTVKKTTVQSEGIYLGYGDIGQELLAGRKKYSSDPAFSFTASVTEAKSLKDNGEIVILVQPVPPFTGKGTYYSKPTFNSPRETFYNMDFIVGTPICVGIRDGKSGRVFATSPANFRN